MAEEYSFFIDSENSTIGVVVDEEENLSISEYNSLDDKDKPDLMELIELLLDRYPETIDEFSKRLVLIDDPEWDVREQLVFIRGDGGEDIIQHFFKSDRAGIEMSAELLPGITYKQLFENTVEYQPVNDDGELPVVPDHSAEEFILAENSRKISLQTIAVTIKQYPAIALLVLVSFVILGVGIYMYYASSLTVILPPDRLQQAAKVDQHLNELKVQVDDLWAGVKNQSKLDSKTRREYWEIWKPLNTQYLELRRSGFGHGSKFNAVNANLKNIRDKLRVRKRQKRKQLQSNNKKNSKIVIAKKNTVLKKTQDGVIAKEK